MEQAMTVLAQVLIIFLLIAIGAFCTKKGILDDRTSKKFSDLVINIINPAVIFMSFQVEYTSERLQGLLLTVLMTFAVFGISIPLSFLLIHGKDKGRVLTERMAFTFSNCGFMGIPLIASIFGQEGVFYVSAVIAVFNIVVWTYGEMMVAGSFSLSGLLTVLKSPNIIAIAAGLIFFIFRIKIPYIPAETLEHLSNMNTPMAMLVTGIAVASADLKKTFISPRIWLVSLAKLLLVPLIAAVLLRLVNAPYMVYQIVILTAAGCPTASITTLLAVKYNHNPVYASELVTATTLLSVATLPLIALVL